MNPVVRDVLERGDDGAMRALVGAAHADTLSDPDLADLAQGLAASGARLPLDAQAADLASTGGPSSLSTLICPLQLRARGLKVPKLGVRGRPAGGVDVLETIPRFRAALDPDAARDALAHSRYIHLLADQRWAPLDARLFAYRQREGAQNVPSLVIASILAKKLAAGATGAGLEIRIAPHGNFGVDLERGRRNAHRYKAVAALLGLEAVCALTSGTLPYQPYVGRGEALVGLAEILNGEASGWLAEHRQLCLAMADAVARAMGLDTTEQLTPALLREAHDALLDAHGTTGDAFDGRVETIRAAPATIFRADRAGVLTYDLERLRALLVARQRAAAAGPDGPPADPAGVILLAPAGTELAAGAPMISVRVCEGERQLAEQLASCAQVRPGREVLPYAGSTLEII